ncbi:peroxiredoxin family protein [Leptothoe spongobia]|uniref:Redoxin domain-containing protein n=1 Tax=Leptothoe spongobia TAU-MAC 1115 TaxID=1967444 RepID=A0A947DHX6_9CYAN|nr:redoxin domain-containing protein [Leptothoe spongobia]MBT9317315.1 redoxin domain-containing protein [Leptothoe spongobia TAU-MAC 1115]
MTAAFKLTSMDFRGVISRRFFKNFLPLPALNRFQVGQTLPDFELPVVGQRAPIKLSSYRHKAVIVIAFTRIFTEKQYCPFCYPHIVSMVAAHKQFEQLGAEVLMITSTDMRQSKIVQQDLGLAMPLLVNPSCATFRLYGTGQALGAPLPAQFVIDRTGKLRFQHLFSFAHTNASAERLLWAVHNASR